MIYTFRFISNEEESFIMDVNINHNQTFKELHTVIQETLRYDESQMTSFFKSNQDWEKLEEITLVDMGSDMPSKSMDKTYIEDIFGKTGENILYVFDFFSERLFFGSVVRMIDAEPPIKLPTISKLEGKIPEQIVATSANDDDLLSSFDDMLKDADIGEEENDLPDDFLDDMNNF